MVARTTSIPLGRKLLFSIIPAAVLFGGLEIGLRIFDVRPLTVHTEPLEWVGADFEGRFPLERDDDFFWRMEREAKIPNSDESLNAMGLRGPLMGQKRPRGTRRVICLGDSNTFGVGVNGDSTFAHRLGRWLSTSPSARWEVLNSGVPGYTLFQMWRWFDLVGRHLMPDVVIVYAGAWNDYTPAIGLGDEAQAERLASAGSILDNSRLVQVLSGGLASLHEKKQASRRQQFIEAWSKRQERPNGPRVPEATFRRLLGTIASEGKALGAKIVFVVPPAPRKTRERFQVGEHYAELVRELGASEADAVVDARRRFDDAGPGDAELFNDIIHPSAEGHYLIAAAVARALLPLDVPDLPPARVLESHSEIVQLRHAQDLTLEAGKPLTPVPLAGMTMQGVQIIVPSPSRLTARGVFVPRQGCLLFGTSYAVPAGPAGDTSRATFRVTICAPGSESSPTTSVIKMGPTKRPWPSLKRHRIDLAAYETQAVDLIFEVDGSTQLATWAGLELHPFR